MRRGDLSRGWGGAPGHAVPSKLARLLFGAFALLSLTAFLCGEDADDFDPNPVQTGSGREACIEAPFDGQLVRGLPLQANGEQNLDFDLSLRVDGAESARFDEPSTVVDASGLSGCVDHWTRGFAHTIEELPVGLRQVEAVSVAPNGRAGISTIFFDPSVSEPFFTYFEPSEIETVAGRKLLPCYRFFEETRWDRYEFVTSASADRIRVYRNSWVNDPTDWRTQRYSPRQCNIAVEVADNAAPGRYTVDVSVTSLSHEIRPSATMSLTVIVVDPGGSSVPPSSPPPPSTAPPPLDVSGVWNFDIVVGDNCGPEPPYSRTVTITQTGAALKVTGIGDPGEVWVGSIDADTVTFGGDREEDKGITVATFTMTVDATGLKMGGSEDWSWTDGSSSCPNGISDVEAVKTG